MLIERVWHTLIILNFSSYDFFFKQLKISAFQRGILWSFTTKFCSYTLSNSYFLWKQQFFYFWICRPAALQPLRKRVIKDLFESLFWPQMVYGVGIKFFRSAMPSLNVIFKLQKYSKTTEFQKTKVFKNR